MKEEVKWTNLNLGLNVIARINDKLYETGRKASEAFRENMRIIFDDFLGNWNYRAVPKT